MVVLRVSTKMLREMSDPVRKERDLHFRRSRITIVGTVLTDDVAFILQRRQNVYLLNILNIIPFLLKLDLLTRLEAFSIPIPAGSAFLPAVTFN